MTPLERASTAAAEAAALRAPGEAAVGAARGPEAAWRATRGQDGILDPSSERGQRAVVGRERERSVARVPARLVHLQALEREDPALGDAERHGPGHPAVERVGRQTLETIALGALEEFLEAPDV